LDPGAQFPVHAPFWQMNWQAALSCHAPFESQMRRIKPLHCLSPNTHSGTASWAGAASSVGCVTESPPLLQLAKSAQVNTTYAAKSMNFRIASSNLVVDEQQLTN
jgi:hypothetical protein